VTHDQEEAFALADRIVVMRDGRVVQQGTPEAVYRHPASPWIARFLGLTNLLPAALLEPGWVSTPLGRLRVERTDRWESGTSATLLIRPEAARPGEGEVNPIAGVVRERAFRGGHYRIVVECAQGTRLALEWPSGPSVPRPGEGVRCHLDPSGMALLPPEER